MALELDVDNKAARFQNCVNYHGQMENNLKHGHGSGTFSDGSTYEGDWLEGLPHGRGVWKNGKEMFEGDFLRGQFHGKGKHTLADGSVYEGDFQNDLRHGHGVLTNSESSVFDCEWFEGKKHGKGSEKLRNGDTFVGEYENDYKSNGLKTYFSSTNRFSSFEGSFSVVPVHGRKFPLTMLHVGKYIYADGKSVEGDFRSIDKPIFTVCWPNGDSYVGECECDIPHGYGTKTLKDKTVLTGKWHKGTLQRNRAWWEWALMIAGVILLILSINCLSRASVSHTNTTITYPDGGVYVGSLVNGTVRHGEGHMSYAGGDTYNGSWANGQRSGRGCSQSADQKAVYEGHWANDTRHGDGVMRFANGDVFNGTYQSDVMHGSGVYTYNSNTSIVGTVVCKGEWFNGSMVNRGQFDYLDGWFSVYGEWYQTTATKDIFWGEVTTSVAWRTTCIGIGSNMAIPMHGQWLEVYMIIAIVVSCFLLVLILCVIFESKPQRRDSQQK